VRPWGIMPGLSRRPAGPEEQLLTESGRDIVVITLVVAVTAGLFAVVADHGLMSRVQRLDEAWLRLMVSGRAGPLTALAKILNILGLVYVTLPVRIVLAAFLAVRRQWRHLAAFAAAVVLSEALIGLLKGIYDRARPAGSLVATSGASLPSGHAVAASVTVVAAVIALVPAGKRTPWALAAALFSILMGLSRAYLGAHWLSDAAAGLLLGTSCALLTALMVSRLQRHQRRRQHRPAGFPGPAGVPPPGRAGGRRNQHEPGSIPWPVPVPPSG
jgi:membrane-associated phospholipid phosphatase